MKFYKLTESDLPLIFSLNESEIKVWCWLSVHLPFENSKDLEIDTSQLAEEIGISRRSVQRALKTIQENEIFDVEFTKAKVKRKTTKMSSGDTDVVEATQMSSKRHRCRQSDTDVVKATQMSSTQLESLTQQEFQDSKIIKTYSDLTDFSEEEATAAKIENLESENLETSTTDVEITPVYIEVQPQTENLSLRQNSAAPLKQELKLQDSEKELLKSIEKLIYNPAEMPWRESATKFKPEIEALVYKANPDWYSLPGGAPNLKKVRDRLKKLESNLRLLNTTAIEAYQELMNYCQMAQMESNGISGRDLLNQQKQKEQSDRIAKATSIVQPGKKLSLMDLKNAFRRDI